MFERYSREEIEKLKSAIKRSLPPVPEIKKQPVTYDSKILVVDDSATVRKILKRSFVDFGFDVANIIEAVDGEDALCVMMEHDGVSLLITDVNMPKIDGLGLIAHLAKNKDYQSLNILLLTSENNDKLMAEVSKYGVDIFIKPFNKDSFFAYLIKMMVE